MRRRRRDVLRVEVFRKPTVPHVVWPDEFDGHGGESRPRPHPRKGTTRRPPPSSALLESNGVQVDERLDLVGRGGTTEAANLPAGVSCQLITKLEHERDDGRRIKRQRGHDLSEARSSDGIHRGPPRSMPPTRIVDGLNLNVRRGWDTLRELHRCNLAQRGRRSPAPSSSASAEGPTPFRTPPPILARRAHPAGGSAWPDSGVPRGIKTATP